MSFLQFWKKPETAPALPIPIKISPCPWLEKGRLYLGMKEIVNGKVNPLITEMFLKTSYHTKENEAWCAAFICWLLETLGYKSSHDAGAYSYASFGVKCELKPGAIVVVQHLTGSLAGHYHVTMCETPLTQTAFMGLGGNQDNTVSIKKYGSPDYKIVSVRWPL